MYIQKKLIESLNNEKKSFLFHLQKHTISFIFRKNIVIER
jgi:hypothetical protein